MSHYYRLKSEKTLIGLVAEGPSNDNSSLTSLEMVNIGTVHSGLFLILGSYMGSLIWLGE